jgi:hypothetical protein
MFQIVYLFMLCFVSLSNSRRKFGYFRNPALGLAGCLAGRISDQISTVPVCGASLVKHWPGNQYPSYISQDTGYRKRLDYLSEYPDISEKRGKKQNKNIIFLIKSDEYFILQ